MEYSGSVVQYSTGDQDRARHYLHLPSTDEQCGKLKFYCQKPVNEKHVFAQNLILQSAQIYLTIKNISNNILTKTNTNFIPHVYFSGPS